MKILRIVYDFPPPWEGLAPGPYELSKAQAGLGNKVTVICGLWPKQSSRQPPELTRAEIVRFFREPFRGGIFFTTAVFTFFAVLYLRIKNRLKLNRKGSGFDLIHGHGHLPFYFHIYKKIFGKIDKIPYFLHLHITAAGREKRARLSGEKIDFITRFIEWPLHKLSDRIGCQVADAIFAVSESVKNEAIKYYRVDPKKIVVIENGVNCQLFKPLKLDKPAKRQLEKMNQAIQPTQLHLEDKIILFVGRHTTRKNLDKLILSLRHLPRGYKLLTIGRGSEEDLENLKRLTEKENLQKRVIFAGFVPYPDTPPIYQNADILVLPSSYEGFPKVVLESLASGVPALASGFKLKQKIAGLNFLDKVEPEFIAQEIKKIVDEQKKVEVEFIKKEYSWATKAKQIQEIYERFLNEK